MDELVKQIAARANISEQQARTAVDTVLTFLKQRLPAPIAKQVEAVLSGEEGGGFGELAKGIGGMLDKD